MEKTINLLSWIGATIGAFVALTAFAFQTFEEKREAQTAYQSIEKRLDRIENKIDQVWRGVQK